MVTHHCKFWTVDTYYTEILNVTRYHLDVYEVCYVRYFGVELVTRNQTSAMRHPLPLLPWAEPSGCEHSMLIDPLAVTL